MAAEPAVEIKPSIEIVAQGVVGMQRRDRGDRSCPQETRQHAKVRVVRLLASEPRGLLQQLPQKFELRWHQRQPLLAAGLDLFELAPAEEQRLAALPHVRLILRQ